MNDALDVLGEEGNNDSYGSSWAGKDGSVFASGAIPPQEAIEWVCSQPNIESIVFGASSRFNIHSTKQLVDKYWHQEAFASSAVTG
jgi:hypothetical protein